MFADFCAGVSRKLDAAWYSSHRDLACVEIMNLATASVNRRTNATGNTIPRTHVRGYDSEVHGMFDKNWWSSDNERGVVWHECD